MLQNCNEVMKGNKKKNTTLHWPYFDVIKNLRI